MRRLRPREQVLMILGACALAAAFEVLFRLGPRVRELGALDTRAKQLETGLTPPRPAADPELARLVGRRSSLRRDLETARAAAAKDAKLFPESEPTALVAISELAERTGVLVRESAPVHASDDASRPERRFVVIATFSSLREFVRGLVALPRCPIHFEKLEIEAVSLPADGSDGDDLSDPHVLVATFVLVL